MKTYTTLTNLFGSLSQNSSTANLALGGQLINDQHRLLLQKYFDNERTVTITTVGAQSLALTAIPAAAATSATLTAVWAYPTCQQYVNFDGGEQRMTTFTYNSTAITWADGLVAAADSVDIDTVGVQDYTIPANVSKIKNNTINVGQLKFQPTFISSRQEWDQINFLPYVSDIPNYCFIYNGKLSIFPIPSTTGNIITFNYKTRVPDLSISDYTTPGTITTMTAGSTAITGGSTTWLTTLGVAAIDVTHLNMYIKLTPPKGDGIWYPIKSFTSETALVLANPAVNTATTAASHIIGQLPLLSEDFHDMLVYGALKVYFSTIVPDTNRYKEFDALYNERLLLLEDYAGTKQVNVDLGSEPQQVNPNLFIYGN